jgi:ABC-type multidrug transport system fused ATPase/permease subunit
VQDARLADVLPTLGVFGFAVLKIFPAIQQIYHALAQMRFATPILAKLHAELSEANQLPIAISSEVLPLARVLQLEDLHFSYPAAGRAALKGLSLSVEANTTVALSVVLGRQDDGGGSYLGASCP